jgi:LmbE family N-acetylglucosaminyl deacetylase
MRSRREALRRDVQRLEQVRLADAVRADDEDDPGLERELERRVRAVVRKRDRVRNQTVFLTPPDEWA